MENSNDGCNELQSIKYKTMLLTKTSWPDNSVSASNLDSLDKFLEHEKTTNANEPWSKLDKTVKLKKLTAFADNYKKTNNLTETEYETLINFFRECLDKKKLQRVKDIIYNKDIGEIKDIPALTFNKSSNHFTLKNLDKRVSTLKGLAPKRKQGGTAKNIRNEDSDNES